MSREQEDTGASAADAADRVGGLRPEPAAQSQPSGRSPHGAGEREAYERFCKGVADRSVWGPNTDNWTRIYQSAGLAYDELTADFAIERSIGQQQIDRLSEENDQLRRDLDRAMVDALRCEPCLAPLFEDDGGILTDENGCTGCTPVMTGDAPLRGPCFAYRSLDRTVAQAIEARRAATAQTGAVHESAVGNADAPSPDGEAAKLARERGGE